MTKDQIEAAKLADENFAKLLGDKFSMPIDGAWEKVIEQAQATYEQAKSFEMSMITHVAIDEFRKEDEWNDALLRTVASSETAKKERAKLDETWRAYEKEMIVAKALKRDAEKWHSIAYQRLETLREVYKKR